MLRESYPITVLCEALGTGPSSYYYAGIEREEEGLRRAIEAIVTEFPTYGYRRVTWQLRRGSWAGQSQAGGASDAADGPGWEGAQAGLSHHRQPARLSQISQLGSGSCNRAPRASLGSDITYIRLAREFVYLAVIMDVFTRSIRGWQLSRSLEEALTLTALKRALTLQGPPKIHHSDQGVQYAATAYTALLESKGVQISMAQIGCPEQNGYAERLMRTIKEEEVALCEYTDFADALRRIGRFLDEVYMHKRIHSSLGYLTPAEFEHKCNGSLPSKLSERGGTPGRVSPRSSILRQRWRSF